MIKTRPSLIVYTRLRFNSQFMILCFDDYKTKVQSKPVVQKLNFLKNLRYI